MSENYIILLDNPHSQQHSVHGLFTSSLLNPPQALHNPPLQKSSSSGSAPTYATIHQVPMDGEQAAAAAAAAVQAAAQSSAQQNQSQSLSINTNGSVPSGPGYLLKITNIPADLTYREATIIFALVIDEVIKVELNSAEATIYAFFKSFNTCLTTYKLLNQKCIFGNDAPINVQIDESLGYEFNNLSLRPGSQSAPTSSIGIHPLNSNGSILQPPSAPGPTTTIGSAGSRSRFSFNDPFQTFDQQNNQTVDENSPQNSSQPQTPINNLNFDWSQSNSASLASKNSSNRRTSSAFFQSNFSNNLLNNSFLNSNLNQPLLNQQQPLHQLNQLLLPQQQLSSQPNGKTISSTPASTQPPASGQSAGTTANSQSQVPPTGATTAAVVAAAAVSANGSSSAHATNDSVSRTSQPGQQQAQAGSSTSAPASLSQQSNMTSPVEQVSTPLRKDVPDLSLLARVPPPANPADQNPPCNTLYVGNLPPDATEQELRALFSPQKGFRRLSFRNKTNAAGTGSNNHGPMCFVEFEDVAHATRALAELYGRILPRSSSSNGKGGIRLSFSKNPLGVRGPQRRSSSNQINGGNGNNNGSTNFNYNYHIKP